MKILYLPLVSLLCMIQIHDAGAVGNQPTLALEQQIASQQGRFGALYDHCGNFQEKAVVGGSIAAWRQEIFRGYQGTRQERQMVEAAFDQSAERVKDSDAVCENWVKQASQTWMAIVQLSEYGLPGN